MSTAIHWFRQDLRCLDNPALYQACTAHQNVIPLYILDCDLPQLIGDAQYWWLHHSLNRLEEQLEKHGLKLCLRKGSPLKIITELIQEASVTAVYWNRCYEPERQARDQIIKKHLKESGLICQSFNGQLLNEPWTIIPEKSSFYQVFTPYRRAVQKNLQNPNIPALPARCHSASVRSDRCADWNLAPQSKSWTSKFSASFTPGEESARSKLSDFTQRNLMTYQDSRNIPSLNATSKLSPHLHFGEISPWRIYSSIQDASLHPNANQNAIDCFLSELIWREFSYYLLYHFPQLGYENFRKKFDAFPWQENPDALKRWQSGQTGYPIIDAGMRELWQTGYMHNRVRMIVASFLTKDLFIDWRQGAAWFFYTLLDADLASNAASWQWVAGCGADAAPYFRIFNPILQSEKFDPDGTYIKHWIPELKDLSRVDIHQPWRSAANLKCHYPSPIVDHHQARQDALRYYQQIR